MVAPMRTKAEKEGGGPGPRAATHYQNRSPHRQDQAADAVQSNGDRGQSTSPEADVRLFLDMLYGGGTGFCHVVYGKDPYRDGDKPPRFRFWSEKHERHAFAYPADADAAVAKVLEFLRAGPRRLCEHQPDAHGCITREDRDGRAVVPARRH